MYVGLGSHRLHVNCTGIGSPAVVFESGLGGTSLEWTKVQPRVAEFTLACSYDRAGYGWSEPGPVPRHAARLAAELGKLLVYASVPRPYVLVGHSFGGLSVRLFAHDNARAVAGLVLLDSTHERQFKRLPAAGILTPTAPTGRTFVIANLWEVPERLPGHLKPLAQGLALRPKAIRTLYSELRMMRHSARQVDSILDPPDVPVAVLARGQRPGARSKGIDGAWLELQRDLASAMPRGSFRVVANSGHHIHLDRPEPVVAAVRAIVEAVRAGYGSRDSRRRSFPPRRGGRPLAP